MTPTTAATHAEATGDNIHTVLTLDSTRGSALHRWRLLRGPSTSAGGPVLVRVYVLSTAVTYLPLVAAALIGSLPLIEPTSTLRLPFLHDWNIALMFLLSFPCVMVLTLTDQHALTSALARVQADGTVTISLDAADGLRSRWEQRFLIANVIGQAVGLAVGLGLVFFNYSAYAPASTGYWIADQGRLEPVGFVFLYCIFLFYAIIPVYVVRLICVSLFLRDLVAHATLRLLPFHPDRSGGLRPMGQLGLRNQYGLTVLGLNVVSLVIVSTLYLSVPTTLLGLIVTAAIAYIILGPIVFMGPLLPFRGGMLRTKNELMGEVAQRLRVELQRLRSELAHGLITKEDEELVDRLRKVGGVIDELPVWPFDANTLRKFLTAYVLPVLGAVGYPAVNALLAAVTERLGK